MNIGKLNAKGENDFTFCLCHFHTAAYIMQATTTQGGVEMETSNIIEVTHLNKQFLVNKQPMEVLHDINLQVKKGEFITIVGHSGCGKSTLLKIICGLVGYEDGQVERNGHPVTGPGPKCGIDRKSVV